MHEDSVSENFTTYLIRYLFLPARVRHSRGLSTILLAVVGVLGVVLVVLSLPPVTRFVWMHQFASIDRSDIIATKDQMKAWLSSGTYGLDICVALLIGGSIFGERLAQSFKETLDKYQRARATILGEQQEELETELRESIHKISDLTTRQTFREQLAALPILYRETKRLYSIAFGGVPAFYKHYLRFILYSSFPGGLYGLVAFAVFLVSCILKLILIYLDSPYLAVYN